MAEAANTQGNSTQGTVSRQSELDSFQSPQEEVVEEKTSKSQSEDGFQDSTQSTSSQQSDVSSFQQDEQEEKEIPQDVEGRTKLAAMSPGQVQTALENQEISLEDAERYTAKKGIAENGLLNSDPSIVQDALKHDIISVDEADEYADYLENPVMFYIGDTAKAVAGGVSKAAEQTVETMGWAAETLLPINQLVYGEKPDFGEVMDKSKQRLAATMPKLANGFEDATSPVSTAGKLMEPFAQYAAGAVGLGRTSTMLKQGELAYRMLRGPALRGLSQKAPKTAKWLAQTGEEILKGNAVEQTVFDPQEERLTDMLVEAGIENEAMNFLKTKPGKDSQALARLKMAVEGTAIGGFADGVLEGLRASKIGLWGKNHGNQVKVTQDVLDHIAEPTGKTQDQVDDVTGTFVRRTEEEPYGDEVAKAESVADKAPGSTSAQQATEGTETGASKDPTEATGEGSQKPQSGAQGQSNKPQGKDTRSEETVQAEQQGLRPGTKIDKSEEELTDQGIQVFAKVMDGEWSLEQVDDTFINNMEFEGSVDAMVRAFRSKNFDEIEAVRGKPKSMQETEEGAMNEMAELMGEDPDTVKKSFQKQFSDLKNLDERVRGMTYTFKSYAEGLTKYIERNFSEQGAASLEQELKVIQHMKQLQEMQHALMGIRTEIGRGLGSGYKTPFEENIRQFDFSKVDQTLADQVPENFRYQVRDQINAFKNAKRSADKIQIAKTAGELQGSRLLLEGALEFVQGNLLWGIDTHLTNIMGGSIAMLNNASKRILGAAYQSGKQGDTKALKEISAGAHGVAAGLLDGLRLPGYSLRNFYDPKALMGGLKSAWNEDEQAGHIWKALFTADPQLDPMAKTEGQDTKGIARQLGSGMNAGEGQMEGSAMQQLFAKGTGLVGLPGMGRSIANILRIPFHGLTAGDEFMKHIGYFSTLHAEAAREGMERGLSGKALNDYINGMAKEPTTTLHKKARYNARDVTFTHPLDGKLRSINQGLQSKPGLVGKIAMLPFFRIVVNLAKFAGENSPLAPLTRNFQEKAAAGGRDRFEAIAGMAQGTALMAAGSMMYENGLITGHIPPDMRETARNKGVQEYSIKIGDRWVSYNRADPAAFMLGLSADIAHTADVGFEVLGNDDMEVNEKFEELWNAGALGIKDAFLDKFFLRNVKGAVDIVMEPGQTDAYKYFTVQQAEKFFPAATAFSDYQKQIADDIQRRTEGFKDMVWDKIKASNQYPRRHSVYGTKLKRNEAYPFPAIGTFRAKTESEDPVEQEMYDLGMPLQAPSETFTRQGVSKKMSQEQYNQLNQYIAELPVKETLTKIVKSPQYQQINDPKTKSKILKSVVSQARSAARKRLLAENQELQGDFVDKFKERAKLVQGLLDEPSGSKSSSQVWVDTER